MIGAFAATARPHFHHAQRKILDALNLEMPDYDQIE